MSGLDPGFTALPYRALGDAALSRARDLGASHADFRFERVRYQDVRVRDGAVQGVGVFMGAGDGTFGTMIATHAPATGVTAGDFDGDGKLDLGVAGGGGAAILLNCR